MRSATEPGLLLSLVKFLLEMNYDNRRILDILISRINGPSKVLKCYPCTLQMLKYFFFF